MEIFMKELIVLGTGNATTIHCYNTCFALKEGEEYFLTDAGGGNGILLVLEQNQIRLEQIHHLFVTHAHSDHIFGVFWLLRMIAARMDKGSYQGTLTVYCHAELAQTIQTIAQLTIGKKIARYVDNRIVFHIIHDGEKLSILDNIFTFFDIRSTKEKQFGFLLHSSDGFRIAFPGDEPCCIPHPGEADSLRPEKPELKEHLRPYIENADWLLHEAFCLYSQRNAFSPYKKHHSTVADACLIAEALQIPHLVLWHTEEKNLSRRAELYTAEGNHYYHGNLIIPEDGQHILFN